MRWTWIAALLIGGLGLHGTNLSAQEELPYSATVRSSSTVVHSAPSRKAYATDIVDSGSLVEVYRHDPGGWCAIRPPESSFSLVRRSAVEIDAQGQVGRINQDEVKAWVGTRIRHRGEAIWQVKLAQGELVEVLDVRVTGEDSQSDPWVLIAPPAGEFRWIHESDLQRESTPQNLAFPDAPSQGPQRDFDEQRAMRDSSVVAASNTEDDGFVTRTESRPRAESPESAANNAMLKTLSPTEQLSLAQQRLSQLMLGSHQVTARELQQTIDVLMQPATPAEVRQQAQQLQARFDRFLDLQLKQTALDRLYKGTPSLLTDTSKSQPIGGAPLGTDPYPVDVASAKIEYAVEGRLNRLIRSGGLEASGYAVQDSSGNIRAMIVAAPGVNLERYLKEDVGIQGSKTPHPRWNVPVVVAERVIKLDRHR